MCLHLVPEPVFIPLPVPRLVPEPVSDNWACICTRNYYLTHFLHLYLVPEPKHKSPYLLCKVATTHPLPLLLQRLHLQLVSLLHLQTGSSLHWLWLCNVTDTDDGTDTKAQSDLPSVLAGSCSVHSAEEECQALVVTSGLLPAVAPEDQWEDSHVVAGSCPRLPLVGSQLIHH